MVERESLPFVQPITDGGHYMSSFPFKSRRLKEKEAHSRVRRKVLKRQRLPVGLMKEERTATADGQHFPENEPDNQRNETCLALMCGPINGVSLQTHPWGPESVFMSY